MKTVKFTNLKLKLKVPETKKIVVEDTEIEVNQWIPIKDIAEFVSFVAENSLDEITNSFSPVRVEVYTMLGLVKFYTNISFTDKQLYEDSVKTYDILESNKVFDLVIEQIPEKEYEYVMNTIKETLRDITNVSNSFVGMVRAASSEAANVDSKLSEIFNKLTNEDNLTQLKNLREDIDKTF